jgi:hypothetical protein
MIFMKPDNKKKGLSGWPRMLLGFVVALVVLVAIAVAMGVFLMKPIQASEHYLQVWKNPVTVTATVTDYDSYDDDGDTDYKSFISYDYNGVHYENIQYENRDDREDLTPLGTQLSIMVSSKDPSKSIEQLKKTGKNLNLGMGMVALILAAVYHGLQKRRLSKDLLGTPDADTVQRDLKIKIIGRMGYVFWLLSALVYGVAYLRYSMVLGNIPLIVAVVCCVFGLGGLKNVIGDNRKTSNKEFQVSRDVLVDKQISTDSDGGDTYRLYYESGDRKWDTGTSKKNYYQVSVGDTVVAVYLEGNKKPTLHYDHQGNAR